MLKNMENNMKSVLSRKLKPGMILAKPVMEKNKNILINSGVVLNNFFINKIQSRNIPVVSIQKDFKTPRKWRNFGNYPEYKISVKNVEEKLSFIKPVVPEINNLIDFDEKKVLYKSPNLKKKLIKFKKIEYPQNNQIIKKEYINSLKVVENILKDARSDNQINNDTVINTASQVVNHVMCDLHGIVELTKFNSINNYLLTHSINTAYTSVMLGVLNDCETDELMHLAIGALLHDIGMVKVKDFVWNKPYKLEFNDLFDIKKHTIYGIDTIANSTGFNTDVAYMAYYHHERMDGSGYPKEKRGIQQVPFYSRILGLADTFQALNSSRCFRGNFPLKNIFKELMINKKNKFDQKFTNLLYDYYVRKIDSNLKNLHKKIKNILIVDDSRELTQITKILIEKKFGSDVSVMTARGVDEVIEGIKNNYYNPDIILLDIMMPKKNGFEFLEEMKQYDINVPVIILSAKREQNTVSRALSNPNVIDYILKPYEKNCLLNKIGKLMGTLNYHTY
ncbi:MAG: response regulator [Candidatus Muiribacteriota bacterium]